MMSHRHEDLVPELFPGGKTLSAASVGAGGGGLAPAKWTAVGPISVKPILHMDEIRKPKGTLKDYLTQFG